MNITKNYLMLGVTLVKN